MPDYEKMYFELFNGVTDIIEELKALQQKAEKLYIDGAGEEGKKGIKTKRTLRTESSFNFMCRRHAPQSRG